MRSRSRWHLLGFSGSTPIRVAAPEGAVAADGLLEDARVVEGALVGVEVRIRPDLAEAGEAARPGLAGAPIDPDLGVARIAAVADDVVDLLLLLAARGHPALDDLDLLQVGADEVVLPGGHDEPGRRARGGLAGRSPPIGTPLE